MLPTHLSSFDVNIVSKVFSHFLLSFIFWKVWLSILSFYGYPFWVSITNSPFYLMSCFRYHFFVLVFSFIVMLKRRNHWCILFLYFWRWSFTLDENGDFYPFCGTIVGLEGWQMMKGGTLPQFACHHTHTRKLEWE